jgi:hypothetical protein
MKQADRAIDWSSDPALDRRIRGRGSPCVLDATLAGEEMSAARTKKIVCAAPRPVPRAAREPLSSWMRSLVSRGRRVGPYRHQLPAAVLGPRLEAFERPIRRPMPMTIGPSATSWNGTASLSRLRLLQRCDEHGSAGGCAISTRTLREGHRAAGRP